MYYFIVNPKSRSGKGLACWREAEHILRKHNTKFRVFFTRYPGHAQKLAEKLSDLLKSHDTLAALGGDGTLNEILAGLKHPETITFAYIPIGSGNDFARGCGLETDLTRAVMAILQPSLIRTLDICCSQTASQSRRFAVSCGIGFDASVCHEALHSPLKSMLNRLHLGRLSYAAIAMKQLLFFKPFQLEITLDNQPPRHFDHVYFAAAMNLPYEGGGFQFCPDANGSDGCLDLIVAYDMPWLKVLLLLPTAFLGKHRNFRGIKLLRCHKALFKTDRAVAVHVDGESAGITSRLLTSAGNQHLNLIIK